MQDQQAVTRNSRASSSGLASTSGSYGQSSELDGASEVYILGRPFNEWGGGMFQKMPPPLKEAILNLGLCHYMVAIKQPNGTVVQFDFGPTGGRDVSASKSGGGLPAEVRETPLQGLPSGEPVLYLGKTMMELEHVREFNKMQPRLYSLYESDCRHYANGLVKYLTGTERSTAQYLRFRYNECLAGGGEGWIWHKGLYYFAQAISDIENWSDKAARDRLLQDSLSSAAMSVAAVSGGTFVAMRPGLFFGLATRLVTSMPAGVALRLPNRVAAFGGGFRAASSRLAASARAASTVTKPLLLQCLMVLPGLAHLAPLPSLQTQGGPSTRSSEFSWQGRLDAETESSARSITCDWLPLNANEPLALATATQSMPWANITLSLEKQISNTVLSNAPSSPTSSQSSDAGDAEFSNLTRVFQGNQLPSPTYAVGNQLLLLQNQLTGLHSWLHSSGIGQARRPQQLPHASSTSATSTICVNASDTNANNVNAVTISRLSCASGAKCQLWQWNEITLPPWLKRKSTTSTLGCGAPQHQGLSQGDNNSRPISAAPATTTSSLSSSTSTPTTAATGQSSKHTLCWLRSPSAPAAHLATSDSSNCSSSSSSSPLVSHGACAPPCASKQQQSRQLSLPPWILSASHSVRSSLQKRATSAAQELPSPIHCLRQQTAKKLQVAFTSAGGKQDTGSLDRPTPVSRHSFLPWKAVSIMVVR